MDRWSSRSSRRESGMAAAGSSRAVWSRLRGGLPGVAVLALIALSSPLSSAAGADGEPPSGPPDGKAEAEKKPEPRRQILGRKKLSPAERKKIEKERADRIKLAEKFQKARLAEYEGVDWESRHKIRTANFDVQCNSTREVAQVYAQMMERIRAKLSEMFPSRIHRNLRAPLLIYKNQEEFINRDPQARFMGRGLGGYYNIQSQGINIYHGTFGFTGTTFSVLCHEGTHYYQGLVLKDFRNMPMWFVEGMAVYFGDGSTFDAKTGKIEVGQVPRDRLADIQDKILKKRYSHLKDLASMTRINFNGSHYADSWALVYFLAKSSDKGPKFLNAYWSLGMERPLTRKDFLDLAEKFYGGVENLEKEYLAYVSALEMPPAGQVVGDYYVSPIFQFDYKSPGPDWEFFEDPGDKKLLVGLFSPGTSAEIRIYYDNNLANLERDVYLSKYLVPLKDRYADLKQEAAKISNLDGYKVSYLEVENPRAGTAKKDGVQTKPEKKEAAPKPADVKAKPKDPRQVISYLLIQVDGVVTIRGLVNASELKDFRSVLEKANENFTLCLTRRW